MNRAAATTHLTTLSVVELDALRGEEATAVFHSCCGSSRWVEGMIARRPFGTVDGMLAAADDSWKATGPDDWREAFSHHPRIGEKRSEITQGARAAAWSAAEQERSQPATASVQEKLEALNRTYEERFGHIYIVCAEGKSADELLQIAERRLCNDPATELRIAADEQRKITELRLRKLTGDNA